MDQGTGNQLVFSVFVYNIIFGSGVLLLPKAFWEVGYALGAGLLVLLAFLSWASCAFVVESLAIANACCKIKERNSPAEEPLSQEGGTTAAVQLSSSSNTLHAPPEKEQVQKPTFSIERKFELVEVAREFFGKYMLCLFYVLMVAYLYGDLCIYLSVVGTTLKNVTCNHNASENSNNSSTTSGVLWFCDKLGLENVFRLFVSVFVLGTGAFVFTNIKKSMAVQLVTMFVRLIAVIVMVSYSSVRISGGAKNDINPVRLVGIPTFFGVCLYSFMCQHSLPSMIHYVRNKTARFNCLVLLSMTTALAMYFVTVFTATFAFKGDEISNIFSMSFKGQIRSNFDRVLYYFLMLFPTFALASSFPIVGITLRENLVSLVSLAVGRPMGPTLRTWLFPILALLPSYVVVIALPDSVSVFAGYVGTYAGSFVQYFIPAALVMWGRKRLAKATTAGAVKTNPYSVWFMSNWVMPGIVMAWTFIGITIVTYYYISNRSTT